MHRARHDLQMTLPQNSAEARLGELPCQVVQQNPSRQHFRKNQCFNVFHIFPCFSCKCSRSVSNLQPNLRKTPRKTKASPRRMVFKVSANGCGSSAFVVASAAATGSGAGARGFVVASLRRGAGAAARSGVLTGCRGAGAGGSALRFQVRTWPGKNLWKVVENPWEKDLAGITRWSREPAARPGFMDQESGLRTILFPTKKKGDLANDLP